MDAVQKDIESRKSEIKAEVRGVFKLNLKIGGWNVPEADDRAAAGLILDVMQEAMDELREAVKEGKYDYY